MLRSRNSLHIYSCTFALAILATTAIEARASEIEVTRWVQGSWVNVRATSTSAGSIVTQLPANTEVRLRAPSDKVCEIAWGEDGQGFIPCKFLGDKPLALADVALPYLPNSNTPNPQHSPARAFWIAPSMAALFDAGKHFQSKMLSEKQRNLENGLREDGQCCLSFEEKPPTLVRYPIPEFEAMKAVLAKGVVAPPNLDPTWPNCHEATDCSIAEVPKLVLPPAKPSYFVEASDILPASASIEQISAHFRIVERGRAFSSPKWELDYDSYRYTGAWDIGRYELTLDQPVFENVIGRTGLVGAYRWVPRLRITPNGPSARCDEGLRNKRLAEELMPDYPSVADELLLFRSTKPLPMKRVKIKSRRIDESQFKPKQAEGHPQGMRRASVYEIDLDGDGMPDLVQWDVWGAPELSGPNPLITSRTVFANINGKWYLFDTDSYGECT